MTTNTDLERFKQSYINESLELLAEMEERLLDLDPETADNEQLNAIFRCAHSIKGGSGAFGLTYITNFTHVLEALLDAMREGKVLPTRDAVDILLKATDIVHQMVRAAQEGTTPATNLGKDILEKLQQYASHTPTTETAAYGLFDDTPVTGNADHTTYSIVFAPHLNLFATGNEPLLLLQELAKLGDATIVADTTKVPNLDALDPEQCYLSWNITLVTDKSVAAIKEVFEFVEDACDLSVTAQEKEIRVARAPTVDTQSTTETVVKKDAQNEAKTPASGTIRVDLEKVDKLVNMVGELVITEAMVRMQTRTLPQEQFSDLLRGVDALAHHMRELQEVVMSVRMQPVKSIFSRLPRIVRDISTQLGKDIRLVVSGESTEVDKTVIEQLGDPLTHMIRNSADHGIETPEKRLAAGKPAQGTIHLSAEHRGGRIVIEISDDGAGINREKVLKKALEKGLVAGDGSSLSPQEIDNLIFHAGFSTADVVSNISGRGVGMDVVRRNIEGMGGLVQVVNRPSQGSTFTVSLPLTLAILDGMIVRVGNENYIIPITSIIETLRPKQGEVRHVEGHKDVLNVRGEFIPVIYLYQLFGIQNAEAEPSRALIVLVESRKGKMGIVVDELVGQQQVVIKSLSANADPVEGISGATILGDGKVSLILEVNDLQGLVGREQKAA